MVEVMSDKMQMQRCCVVVTGWVEKIDSGGKGRKGLAKHWRAARLASVKLQACKSGTAAAARAGAWPVPDTGVDRVISECHHLFVGKSNQLPSLLASGVLQLTQRLRSFVLHPLICCCPWPSKALQPCSGKARNVQNRQRMPQL